MHRYILLAIVLGAATVSASGSAYAYGGAPNPVVWAGGALIIALLVAILFVLLRRAGDAPSNSHEPSGYTPPPRDREVRPPNSGPVGMRGVMLHGFDSHNKAVRFEFKSEELRDGGVVIGRGRDARAMLSDDRVGRAHARLYMVGERIEVKDLDSTNKTSVNGRKLEKGGTALVQFGDKIGFGPVELTLSKL